MAAIAQFASLNRLTVGSGDMGQPVHAMDDDLEAAGSGLLALLGLTAQFDVRWRNPTRGESEVGDAVVAIPKSPRATIVLIQ